MDTVKIDSRFADKNGEIMVVELEGYIDQSNYHRLQKMFDDIINSGCYKIIVDVENLDYMSSAGWGVFVGEVKRFRDNSGDIKLSNLHDDILDVFQLLEFYHILDHFSSIQEAAASFDPQTVFLDLVEEEKEIVLNEEAMQSVATEVEEVDIDVEKLDEPGFVDKTIKSSEAVVIEGVQMPKEALHLESLPKQKKLAELPLREKIKRIVAQNPLLTTRGIKKILKHQQFGKTSVGYFKLRRILKGMDLHTKDKRYRYYRSI